MDGMNLMSQRAAEYMGTTSQNESSSQYSQNFQYFQNTTSQFMGMLNEGDRFNYPPHIHTEPVQLADDLNEPQELHRRQRRGRRGRGRGLQDVEDVQPVGNFEQNSGNDHYRVDLTNIQQNIQFGDVNAGPSFASPVDATFFPNSQQEITPLNDIMQPFPQDTSQSYNYFAHNQSPYEQRNFGNVQGIPCDLNLNIGLNLWDTNYQNQSNPNQPGDSGDF
jgi:hypothetical protein